MTFELFCFADARQAFDFHSKLKDEVESWVLPQIQPLEDTNLANATIAKSILILHSSAEAVNTNIKGYRADRFRIQTNEIPKERIHAAYFDMDSTLIDMEVIVALAERAGVAEEVSQITEAAMRGELDFNQSFQQRVGLLKGLSEEAYGPIRQNLPINAGVEITAAYFKQKQIKGYILSGGFKPFTDTLKTHLNFEDTLANELLVDSNNCFSGETALPIVDGKQKEAFVRRLERVEKGQKKATHLVVGDGANDLDMMSTTHFSFAYKAKPLVQQKATFRINHTGMDCLAYFLEAIERIKAITH